MKDYKNAFAEVYEILLSLEEEDFKKIPGNVLEVIEQKRNREYNYVLMESTDLSEQPMLPETKAILFNLFRDYLCTEKQRESILRMQREERLQNEKRKSFAYHGKRLFQEESVTEKENEKRSLPVEIKRESVWRRVFDKVRSCFVK